MVEADVITKRCPRCEHIKALSGFHRSKGRPDGRNVYCRECQSAWHKAHYLKKDPEELARVRKQKRDTDLDKSHAYEAAYRERQREHLRLKQRQFREAHPGAYKDRMAEWAKANPDKRCAKEARRRAARFGSVGQYTGDDVAMLLKYQTGKCAYCRIRLGKKYHVDHIVALAKGGGNSFRNIQLTCALCNMRKSSKDPMVFARQMGKLL